jgi:hypothetical protein
MKIRTLLAVPAVLFTALLVTAAPAGADTSAAIDQLKSNNLYVDESAGAKLEQGEASSALSDSVKVAVLPSNAGDARSLATEIGERLGGDLTVGVFVGNRFNAASNVLCRGQASSLATRAVNDNISQLRSNNDLTATIKDFASMVKSAGHCSRNAGQGTSSPDIGRDRSSGTSGWAILGIFGGLGAAAVGALAWRRKRKDRRALADARALIQPYYDRLAGDISNLQPGDNATARQALSDASERFNSGGSQLASATTLAQLGGARRSILEGLQATRTARVALGLDPGPDLPPLAESTAPQLTDARQIDVGGQTVQGYPNYTPGAPYYFAGGGGYAGGWYSMPFWQSLLIAEALTPGWGWGFGGMGWGGGWGGGGYGYDSGFESGYDEGRESVQQDGGDWGSSGGGDWGGGDWGSGGGGDWGGGGGGDWGGGGGDSGGGSW